MPISDELDAPTIHVRGDSAHVGGQIGGDVVIYRVALSGAESVEPIIEREESSAALLDVDEDGRILHFATSFLQPPELVLDSERVTSLNDAVVATYAPPRLRSLEVTAPDGLTTDAWALLPTEGEGPWPTVLCVHGGPYGAFGSVFSIDFHLLAGAGFAVLFHNFRGSYGYGRTFSERICGDWGRNGSLDHHATLDEAIRAGIADPERLGVCGLSHGGFATCWLAGTSDRFKAAVAENPFTSWANSWGIADQEWFFAAEQGGTPAAVPDTHHDRSPLTYAPHCQTPMLFVIGEDDLRCHPTESEQYYRVLKSNGVPAEMLRLPNSSHTGAANGPVPARIAQNEALVDWFTRYLLA